MAAAKGLLHETWQADDDKALAAERRWQRRLLVGDNQRIAVKRNLAGSDKPFVRRRIKSL